MYVHAAHEHTQIVPVDLLPSAVLIDELHLGVARRWVVGGNLAPKFCIHPTKTSLRCPPGSLISRRLCTNKQRVWVRASRTKLRGSAAGGGGERGRCYKAEEPHMCGATSAHTLQNDTAHTDSYTPAGNFEELK